MGKPPKTFHLFIGVSIIFTIHFGVPLFLETSIFMGFHVGKYTVRPMDPSWDIGLSLLNCGFEVGEEWLSDFQGGDSISGSPYQNIESKTCLPCTCHNVQGFLFNKKGQFFVKRTLLLLYLQKVFWDKNS